MAVTPAYYNGTGITCYPSSNAKDDGKLNMEFNMARLVTRVTSKNFCIINPSYEITTGNDESTGNPILIVGTGQCSINGMDLIMTEPIQIAPPPTTGTFHLAFKLYRDGKGNVQGDFERGVDTIFQGLYLDYYAEKDETDRDMLWLASVDWDGTAFSNIEEDEDKYGRIWAEDILCKIVDPKHPDVSRLLLQDWLYNVPDWYFSKEGDIIYGNLQMTDGRNGSGGIGIDMGCSSSTNADIVVKAPSTPDTDTDKIGRFKATDKIVELDLGQTFLKVDSDLDNQFFMTSPNNINITSNEELHLIGAKGATVGSGGNGDAPQLELKDHKATFTDNRSAVNKYEINFVDANTIQQTLGKAIWQYDNTTKYISLLPTDITKFNIKPDSYFEGAVDIKEQLNVGTSSTYRTRITPATIAMVSATNKIDLDTTNGIIVNGDTTAKIQNRNTTNTKSSILDKGSLELKDSASKTPYIDFIQGSNDVRLSKVADQQALSINGRLDVAGINSTANVKGTTFETTNGTITFSNGSNVNATINKSSTNNTLYTSGPFNIGETGNQALQAGNTKINGNINVTGNYTTSNGNITTTNGTITGKKVIGAVYQGFGELFRKVKNDVIDYGDIVCIREDGLVHKVETEQDLLTVIGICSDTIGVQMGGLDISEDERVEVEMLGQIWVKTNDIDIKPGSIVKALPDATVTVTTNINEKFGIAETTVIDGKVKIIYCVH